MSPEPTQLTSRARVIIAHLSTDATVSTVVHLMHAREWLHFEFDAEERERRLAGNVGHGGGSKVLSGIILNIACEAVVGDEFSRAKMQDVILERPSPTQAFHAVGFILLLVRFASGGRAWVLGTPSPPNPVIGSSTGELWMLRHVSAKLETKT